MAVSTVHSIDILHHVSVTESLDTVLRLFLTTEHDTGFELTINFIVKHQPEEELKPNNKQYDFKHLGYGLSALTFTTFNRKLF